MSEERDALERAQARVRELEERPMDEALAQLASALEREAEGYEQLLQRGERRELARETTGTQARLMTFGFALLFVSPSVAMVGVSVARFFRHQPELAALALAAGAGVIVATLGVRTQRAVAHLFSAEWRAVKQARRTAARLRALLPLP